MNKIDFKSEFENIAGRQLEHKVASVALQHVVMPITIAILGVSSPYLWSLNIVIPITLWLITVVIYVLIWWKSNPLSENVYRLLLQKQHDDRIISELNSDSAYFKKLIGDLYIKNIASFALRAMSVDYIKSIVGSGLSKSDFQEMLDEIMAPFYLQGDVVFGFEISEKWSISIYLFDCSENILKPVWRQKSNSHPSQGIGREWRPGEGHVGKAFIDRRPILTGNARDEAVAQLCGARLSKQEKYDSDTYVSFTSVPIAVASNDSIDPYGVLVVTSDREERLSEESATELLMHVAETMAVILELSQVNVSCLVQPNRGTKYESDEGESDHG